jgi:hypothetical protein
MGLEKIKMYQESIHNVFLILWIRENENGEKVPKYKENNSIITQYSRNFGDTNYFRIVLQSK